MAPAMTHIPDLARVSYSNLPGHVRAVGWLEHPHPYPRGPIEPEFEAALRIQASCCFADMPSLGVYFCSLCEAEGRLGPDGLSSQDELLIPAMSCLFEAPIWIVHYVLSHGYRPPDEFRRAVINCPPPESEEYAEQMRPYVGGKLFERAPIGKRGLGRMLRPSEDRGTEARWQAKRLRP